MIEAIIRELGGWLKVFTKFKDLTLTDFSRDWVTTISCLSAPTQPILSLCWKAPPQGVLKLNFNGASKGNPRPAGFGCVIRDHNGDNYKFLCGPLGHCNSTKAKTMGLLMGIRELKSMGAMGALVEGDLTVVIGWG